MRLEEQGTTEQSRVFAAAPAEPSARQHYFIEAARAVLEKQGQDGEKTAAARSYKVVTFGCQMNARDSEKLGGMLEAMGYREAVDERDADLVLFNTCTVRENANEHLYGRLGRLKPIKKAHPDRIIGLCGCMMQETDEVDTIRKRYSYIDLIFGTHNLYTFPELLYRLLCKRAGTFLRSEEAGQDVIASSAKDLLRAKRGEDLQKLSHRPVVSVWKDTGDMIEDLPSARKYAFKQGVNIMFGCNNFCSYCIVPYVRGREKSRQPQEILREVEALGRDGVQEIMLLGQNVNSYGKTLEKPYSFANLLRAVDQKAEDCGIARVRFMTSHPKDLSRDLVEAMAEGRHICRQFHLPLQAGSDRILRRMNRHYTKAEYLEKAAWLREAMPDISISTDIIVGFPGETEADFEETLAVVEAMRYDAAYTFIYSKRSGTPAAAFPEQVPEDVVKERFDRLLALQTRIAEENCKKLEGAVLPALFEEVNGQRAGFFTGRLENNAVVHVPGNASLIGQIRPVRLCSAHGFYYTGELAE